MVKKISFWFKLKLRGGIGGPRKQIRTGGISPKESSTL